MSALFQAKVGATWLDLRVAKEAVLRLRNSTLANRIFSYQLRGTHTLLNPVAPVEFLVSTDGSLVTIDNWHNRGYGVVVAIYAANGSLVRSYELADLFSGPEIDAFPRSISSVLWRDAQAYIRGDQPDLLVNVPGGAWFLFGLQSGRFKYCEPSGQSYQCRDTNANRVWRSNADIADPR